ncbi:MAG: N-6 DNA methylase [Aequorivita antarctica]
MNIKDLVKKYHSNREAYLKAEYNETQFRTDFLDPLFEMLGWDIKNSTGKSTNEREVLVEEGLKADASSNTKKPDYTFRLFSERKFFLEAKKPNVKIESDNESAKQIRRYGFTAKLKISVLSNFEYLVIYDCSQKVGKDDGVTKSRIHLYHYTEYESAFEDIKKQLGKQAVYSGEFDDTWKEIEEQLKLSSVDDLFLSQINEWRIVLGKEIYSHKPDLSIEELNDIAQSYINSIIFLRVCEDRNLEIYKTLLNLAENNDFASLIKKFKEADKKYNAGLFNQPLTDNIISDNSSAFWEIIKNLYFPESTYSFSVFASDILGNIYEIFLGEQLAIENGQILLKKKPENVDRDIVTTPTFIIQDILRQTVVEYCKNKTDEEIINSSFADIACGSGAFLLETYQLLQDTLVDFYLLNDQTKLIQRSINTFKLPFALKKKVLENCIFGIDKDYNAVQACKFGLLLKLLENEDNATITTPALPTLDKNIQFGNSLIETAETNKNNQNEINPFDFGKTRFDVIVGNPPYMTTEHMKEFTPLELPIYKLKFESSYKQFDKYFIFIERGLELLNEGGYLGFIVPSKFLKVTAGKKLRKKIGEEKLLLSLVDFGAEQVFQNKTTYTCLLILRKVENIEFKHISINDISKWKTKKLSASSMAIRNSNQIATDNWVLIPPHLHSAYQKIKDNSVSLINLVGRNNLNNGIQTSKNPLYIHYYSKVKEDDNYYYIIKDNQQWKIEKELTQPYYQTVRRGEDRFYTYRNVSANSFVIYPYKIDEKGKATFIEIDELKKKYSGTYQYFKHFEEVIKNRSISPLPTEKDWYKYGRSQHLTTAICDKKIVVGVLSNGYKYSIDHKSTFISAGGTAGYCSIKTPKNSNYSIYYLQALLGSKYLEWITFWYGEIFRGNFVARGTKVLEKLPIIKINFDNVNQRNFHNKIAKIQEELIDIQGKIDKNNGNKRALIPLQRQFDSLKTELDDTLKTLFNLGEADSDIPLVSEIYATN